MNARPQSADRNSAPLGWWSALIVGCALLVRLLHLAQLQATPLFAVLLGDSRGYVDWARQIAGGDLIGQAVFYQAPLYPYFLGGLLKLFGDGLLPVRLAQAVIGSIACLLLAGAGRRFFSRRAGIVAGLALALYAPAIFLDSLIQKSVLDGLLVCLLLWLLSGNITRPGRGGWFWIGITLGALILTRENALVLILAFALWFVVSDQLKARQRLALAACFLAGLLAILLPVALRNRSVGGEFHLTTSQLGTNLYIGNNPAATGSYVALRPGRGSPEFERRDATELAQLAEGRSLTPAEVSDFWVGRTIDYIRAKPGAWLALMLRKTAMLSNTLEFVDTEDQYTYAEYSLPLKLTGWITHFGVLVPLALLGICVTWHDRHRLWLLYAMLALFSLSVVAFYVVARYRFPLVPILILFSAAGLVGLSEFMRTLKSSHKVLLASALLAVAIFANWPIQSKNAMRTTTLSNLGSAYLKLGELEQATAFYQQALTLSPDYANANYNLGIVAQQRGDDTAAIDHYKLALQADPDHALAHSNLAGHLLRLGNYAEAIAHCERALQIAPDQAPTQRIWGQALQALGQPEEADRHFRQAFMLEPDRVKALISQARTQAAQNKTEAAITSFLEVLDIEPRHTDALGNVVMGLTFLGRLDDAIQFLQDTIQKDPEWHAPKRDLAWILATHPDAAVHDPQQAVFLAEQAAALTGNEDARILDTLAAAQAATGQFDAAITTAKDALARATAAGDAPLAGRISKRLELYERSKAYTSPAPRR
jgi:tetratricopeptide (TPR) repeat protein